MKPQTRSESQPHSHPVRIRRTGSEKVFIILNTFAMLLFSLVILYPVLNVIAVSLSTDQYVYAGAVSVYPLGFKTDAYAKVLSSYSIWTSFGNSVFVSGMGALFTVFFTSLAAYPMACVKFHGKKLYTFMIMLTMWFGGGMVPTFLVMSNLGLVNSLWSLIILSLLGAYNIVVLRSAFHAIPVSLLESASLDGANDFRILFQIVIPLSKATLATIALWSLVGHWNEFTNPVIYLRDYSQYTLQVLLRDVVLSTKGEMLGIYTDDDVRHLIPEQITNATIVVAMIPMLIIYPFLQRYFVKGTMIGSVKE